MAYNWMVSAYDLLLDGVGLWIFMSDNGLWLLMSDNSLLPFCWAQLPELSAGTHRCGYGSQRRTPATDTVDGHCLWTLY